MTQQPPDARVPAPERPELAEYLRALRTYKLVVVLVAGAVAGAVALWTLRQPRIYEATCSIEYDPNPPRPLGTEVEDVAAPTADFWTSREFFETQNRILSSRVIAERVVQHLGLQHDRGFLDNPSSVPDDWSGQSVESAALLLQDRISVEAVRGTRLVEIHVRDQDPQRAALIANTIAETFIEKTIEDRLGSTVSALEWLGDQLDDLRTQLDQSELALHEFKEDHNILSVSMEDRQNLVARDIEQFSQALAEARTHRLEQQARLLRLRALAQADTVDEQASSLSDFPTIAPLQAQLRAKLAERDGLSERYGDQHPRIQAIDAEITSLRDQLQHEIAGLMRAAEADVREASAIESGLRDALDEAHRAGLELNLREIEYSRLSRQRENNLKLYELVLQRTTETDLTRMLRTTHVRLVDRALRPSRPTSPRVTVNIAAGLGAGIVLGVALALLLSRLDRRINSSADVEDIGVTVLGVLPLIADTTTPRAKKPRRRPRGSPEPVTASPHDLIAHQQPMSAAAENCRTIRTNVMFMAVGEPLRTLVVTSASPREGKTTVVSNLAISIAQSGRRVLVIDTDLRRPRVHRAFGVQNRRGVTTVLIGDASMADIVQETVVPGLFVVASGPIPPNPSELLHGERFGLLLKQAAAAYDFVILDSPPLGAVVDAAVIAPQLDGVILVVRAGQTTRDAVKAVVRQIRDVRGRLVGGVVNGVDTRRNSYEGSGYYYYRREGYYYSDVGNDSEDSAPAPPPSDAA